MRRTDRGVHPGRAADQRFHLRPLRFPSPGGGTSRSPFSKGPSFPTVIIFFLPRGLLSSLQSPARAGTVSFPEKHLWAAYGRPFCRAGLRPAFRVLWGNSPNPLLRRPSAPSNPFAEAHAGGWESVVFGKDAFGPPAGGPLPCGPAARLP